jgi:hypothetical protein
VTKVREINFSAPLMVGVSAASLKVVKNQLLVVQISALVMGVDGDVLLKIATSQHSRQQNFV